jgi:signal transduction histidine kinase
MTRNLLPRRFRKLFLLFAALAELLWTSVAFAAPLQKQVLVLFSTRRDGGISVIGERDIPRILRAGLKEGVDYYSEYIDNGRFTDSKYVDAYRDFLRLKYREQRFDVIIAVNDLSLEFLGTHGNDLFPGVPVVFFSRLPDTQRIPNSTGLMTRWNLRSTLDLAMQLQPDTRNVFVVDGKTSLHEDLDYLNRLAHDQFESLDPVTVTYLTGLPTSDLEAKLTSLPERSIIFYLSVNRDGAGEMFHPLEYIERLAAVANAPIYSWAEIAMDHGIVGGSLKNQTAEVAAVAELALRVLRGEPADSIPAPTPDLSSPQVDWRQLRRWSISESRLPAGTIIRFKELSAWERYKVYIVGAIAVLLAQSTLIVGLLYQRRARHKAEGDSRHNLALAADANRRLTMTALTGSIAHELSQPLNSILHNAQAGEMLVTSNRATPESLTAILSEICTADVQATQIVERHRSMLKNRELNQTPLDIRVVVSESLALVAHDTRARRVEVDVALPAGPCVVNGDQVLLQQVFVNLMMNAMDAMGETPPDRRRISVQSTVGHNSVEVSVRDAGTGLPAKIDGHVFEPFVTTKTHGIGIGLAITRTILEAHRGSIDARNNPEGGATFSVTLPCNAN